MPRVGPRSAISSGSVRKLDAPRRWQRENRVFSLHALILDERISTSPDLDPGRKSGSDDVDFLFGYIAQRRNRAGLLKHLHKPTGIIATFALCASASASIFQL